MRRKSISPSPNIQMTEMAEQRGKSDVHVCVWVACLCACECACMRCVYTCTCGCEWHVHVCCIHVCLCACVYMCMCTCVCSMYMGAHMWVQWHPCEGREHRKEILSLKCDLVQLFGKSQKYTICCFSVLFLICYKHSVGVFIEYDKTLREKV